MRYRLLKFAIVPLLACLSAALIYVGRHVHPRGLARANEAGRVDDRSAMKEPEDAGKRAAQKLASYLRRASVEAIEFRLDHEPVVRLDQPAETNSLFASFVRALDDPALRLAQQRHQPTRAVLIRFLLKDGTEVRLDYVGLDMFGLRPNSSNGATESINLKSPMLTACFAEQFRRVVSLQERSRR